MCHTAGFIVHLSYTAEANVRRNMELISPTLSGNRRLLVTRIRLYLLIARFVIKGSACVEAEAGIGDRVTITGIPNSHKPTFGESARFHLSDHRLFAWHNFRFPDIQTSVGCAVQCDSSMRIDHGGRVLWSGRSPKRAQ